MADTHPIVDSDKHFVIDPITRAITNSGVKNKITQYDHNSERYTFEIPRIVEGHDMSQCNVVQIHYVNTDKSDSRLVSKGVYEADDMETDSTDLPQIVTFSWLISGNATKYAGSLTFNVHFKCVIDGVTKYEWNTDIYAGATVCNGYNNSESEEDIGPDVIEQFREELKNASETGFSLPAPVNFVYSKIPIEGNRNLNDMAYGNGRFVITGENNGESVSLITTDFVNYKRIVLPERWGKLRFVNGKFVLIGRLNNSGLSITSNVIKTSEDGETWTDVALPAEASWLDIAYGNGYYVAIAKSSDISAYSSDLANWAQISLPASKQWQSLCYGNGHFIAVAFDGTQLAAFYPESLRWIVAGALEDGYYYDIFFHDGKFYIPISKTIGESTNEIRVGDVLEWEGKTLPVSAQWQSMTFGAGYGIVFASTSDGMTGIQDAAYTADGGETWNHITMPAKTKRLAAAYGRGIFACLDSAVEFCNLLDNF